MADIYFQPVANIARCVREGCEERVQFLRLANGTGVFLCGNHDPEPTA